LPDRLAARVADARQMMKTLSAGAVLLLAACSTPPPSGPGVLVLPGTGKNFDQFRFDEQECRGYAHSSIGGKAAEYAATDTAGSLQLRYDHAFTQCMYARGHRVPVSGRYSDASRPTQSAARTPPPPPPAEDPPAARTPPPPPAGPPPAEAPPDYRPK
jgi:hypothetical protein